MRVTITGKTASTITFNTLGIVLRGNTSAIHIDIKNDEQMRELIGLKNANFIDITKEDLFEQPKKETIISSQPLKQTVLKNNANQTSEKKESEVAVEEIEDAPTQKTETVKKIGRPKGSKNLTSSSKAIKAKPIQKLANALPSTDKTEDNGEKETITIMTANGVVQGKCARSMSGDLQESEKTMASIEALRLLDEEEASADNTIEIDESKLDPSERMGNKATVVNGMNSTASVTMKNSSLPESEAVKNSIKFIDSDMGHDDKNNAEDSFIDRDENESENETSTTDDFLEI
jgi:hypothetical protein